jgi:hypothetical protein
MIDFPKLYATLSSQLASEIGSYTATDGSTAAAIYIVNNVDLDPPRDLKISGVECLIYRSLDRVPQACFGGIVDKYQYAIELTQHDRSKNLNSTIETLFYYWQRIRIAWHRVQTEEDLEQMRIYLPSQQYFKIIN